MVQSVRWAVPSFTRPPAPMAELSLRVQSVRVSVPPSFQIPPPLSARSLLAVLPVIVLVVIVRAPLFQMPPPPLFIPLTELSETVQPLIVRVPLLSIPPPSLDMPPEMVRPEIEAVTPSST